MNITTFRRRRNNNMPSISTSSCKEHIEIDDCYYQEISSLTKAGGWRIDFVKKKTFLDVEARRILELPEDYIPTLRNGYKFYAEEHLEQSARLFADCARGIPFDQELKMVTYRKKIVWVKAHGRPIYGESGEIIGAKGVFQDIDEEKNREIKLQHSLGIIEGHNKRLFNFAHIVSHNLRSHVCNLQLTSSIFDTSNFTQDQQDLFNNFTQIGENLDKTLKHLNEIVTIQTAINQELVTVNFNSVYKKVCDSIKQLIQQNKTVIYTEFSEVEQIEYIPAYLESILTNLITNAIKYKHPDRDPEISIFTYEEQGKKFLVVKDNGCGIDLDLYGDQIFKMHKTFHNNKHGKGLGLFLIKSQIESLGGQVSVESKPDKFAKFIIQLN